MRRFSTLALGFAVLAMALTGCRWESVPDPGQPGYIDDGALERLRECESGGRYDAVSSTGKFRGAYQFDRPTWDDVASRHAPWVMGVDPAQASPNDQDSAAAALFAERGAQPWPHCGRRI